MLFTLAPSLLMVSVAVKGVFTAAATVVAAASLHASGISPWYAAAAVVPFTVTFNWRFLILPVMVLAAGFAIPVPVPAALMVGAVTVAALSQPRCWWVLLTGLISSAAAVTFTAVNGGVIEAVVSAATVPLTVSAFVAAVAGLFMSADPVGLLVPATVPKTSDRVSLVFVADDPEVVNRVVAGLIGFGGSSPSSVEALVVCAGPKSVPAVSAVGSRFSRALVRSATTIPTFVPVVLSQITVGRVGLVRFRREMRVPDMVASVVGHLTGDTLIVVTGRTMVGDLLRLYRSTPAGQVGRSKTVTVTPMSRAREVFPFTPALPPGSGETVGVSPVVVSS